MDKDADGALVKRLTEVLRAAGFDGIETRWSSRSVTVSAHMERRTAVLHIAEPDTASRMGVNAPLSDAIRAVRPMVPGVDSRSGSGTAG
ncbi:hypothetical protein GCM10010244_84860 [Streptomyces coeruleorubidus]|nr:hypothetical protein GCM10010244_84860 [Streptomyces bellus]